MNETLAFSADAAAAPPPLTYDAAVAKLVDYFRYERGFSRNHELSTCRHLRQFARWASDWKQKPFPGQVTQEDFLDFMTVEKNRGLAPSSLRQQTIALKTFFAFLHERGLLPSNPAEKIAWPKEIHRLPESLTRAQVERLLAADLSSRPYPARDRAMVELLYSSGVRVSELTNAQICDLDLRARTLRVTGKGNKTRLVVFGNSAAAALEAYLARERSIILGAKEGAGELFVTRSHDRITPAWVWRIVKDVARLAGLDARVYPHLLRHSFASHLVQGGADVRVVQELLGHSDVSTTQAYLATNISQLQEVHRRCHPRSASRRCSSISPSK